MFHATEDKISIFRNDADNDHSHKNTDSWGINKDIKEEIKNIYQQGTKTPLNILYELRDRNLKEPTIEQLRNYINRIKITLDGKSNISYGELEQWCSERLSIPENEHEPFISGYEIKFNDLVPDSSKFRIAITTKYILLIALKTNHICADATY